MRILYSVTGAVFGGAVAHVLGLMRADIAAGHTVGLVAAPELRLMSEARDIGVEVFPNPYFIRSVQLHNDLRALWPVFQAVRRFNPDIISAHSTKAGYAARLVGAVLRKPVVFTAHGWPFADGRSLWQRWLLSLAEWLAARATAAIICVSAYDRRLALKFKVAPPEKLVLIHNGVDSAPFLGAKGEQVRREFGLGEVPVLAMVGRLAPQKDPLTLLEACKLLKADFRLMIVGDGELRGQMEEFVALNDLRDKVTLTGERHDIPAIMAASDILVLSSRWEGLPLVIIEAGFIGLPVVAAGVGGVPELIEDGVTGFIVPPRDPKALAGAIWKLLGDAELRRRFGTASREKALRQFTFDRMLTKTRRLYEDILRKAI
ncbi:MAG: glycosyltransferase family 4 protein [Chloroflexota bacterium]